MQRQALASHPAPPSPSVQAKRVEKRLADKKMKMELHDSGGCQLMCRAVWWMVAPANEQSASVGGESLRCPGAGML